MVIKRVNAKLYIMKKKTLKFNKKDISDLTKAEQKTIIGGDGTFGENCTITCKGKDGCDDLTIAFCYGYTGGCLSVYGGQQNCSPESDVMAATCTVSVVDLCHTNAQCTYGDCTDGCPRTYAEVTCDC